MTKFSDNAPFLPSFDDWTKLYSKWSEKIAKSLWKSGSPDECREAVHEAFLKVLGLHPDLHLEKPLTPKSEGCWYGFLHYQAKGVLSNRHRFAKRFEQIEDYKLVEDENTACDDVIDEKLMVCPSQYESDKLRLKDEVRSVVKIVCGDAGVTDRNLKAFIMFVLDGADGKSVVCAIPSLSNTNNLYQIKNRIMNLLVASSDRFADIYDEFLAA